MEREFLEQFPLSADEVEAILQEHARTLPPAPPPYAAEPGGSAVPEADALAAVFRGAERS